MEHILEQLNPAEHCSECGALLAGQSICAHCGHEEQPELDGARVIPLLSPFARHLPLVSPAGLDRRIA